MDTVEFNTIGKETSDPLAYDAGSEHHRKHISTLGMHGGQLDRER